MSSRRKGATEEYTKRDCKQVVTAHVFTVVKLTFHQTPSFREHGAAKHVRYLFHVIASIE
jgi:hypothetical protein